MKRFGIVSLGLLSSMIVASANCGEPYNRGEQPRSRTDGITLDPATGLPYAFTFQFPIAGFDTSDFGFGFGSENDRFCLESANGVCLSYGFHLGRDTRVPETPLGTEVLAPADSIVRITTDVQFGGYGSDSSKNPAYEGCVIVLENELGNGQPMTTLLGHVKCESLAAYDPATKMGNPPTGTLVHRGQYVAHVNHYWAGVTQTTDWHHVHWGMRRGRFQAAKYTKEYLAVYVKGYAKKAEFSVDPGTRVWAHPEWIDPFVIVSANSDPALSADAAVRHHPSGTLLEDHAGLYWLVMDDQGIARVPSEVMVADHYDAARAIRVSDQEIACYTQETPLKAFGPAVLYQRPNSSTVVMAYPNLGIRYDVIRWEALLSWGYDGSDLLRNAQKIATYEATASAGFRLLRPGTLVKAEEESEVAIVTAKQTRLPIASAEVFEALGFAWERVVSLPQSVLTDVAGPRENALLDLQAIHACALAPSCPNAGDCGGGAPPDQDAGAPPAQDAGTPSDQDAGALPPEKDAGVPPEVCNGKDDNGNGQIDEIFLCQLGAKGGGCITGCNTAGFLICTAPNCMWGECHPYPEDCKNTIDDDCNGLTDCEDPVCAAAANCQKPPDPVNGFTLLSLLYQGPAASGLIHIEAWWQPPNAATRTWATIGECTDAQEGDGELDCSFALPTGTTSFEFQIVLPDGRFWGDESCSPKGGCGATIGTVSLKTLNGGLSYIMVQNNPNNQPYYNGHIDKIP